MTDRPVSTLLPRLATGHNVFVLSLRKVAALCAEASKVNLELTSTFVQHGPSAGYWVKVSR